MPTGSCAIAKPSPADSSAQHNSSLIPTHRLGSSETTGLQAESDFDVINSPQGPHTPVYDLGLFHVTSNSRQEFLINAHPNTVTFGKRLCAKERVLIDRVAIQRRVAATRREQALQICILSLPSALISCHQSISTSKFEDWSSPTAD